jgi:SAM-dependent methyltransferase
MPLSEEQRASTLERFDSHRRAWDRNPALRALYAEWYGRIADQLPPLAIGPRVELGSGPGFARQFIPDLELTDLVRAPWHDRELDAEALPYGDASLGALVLFDVLHHLPSPRRFFAEAIRVLRPGGRLVMCEPYIGPLSYPVYKLFHEEPVDLGVDPLADQVGATARDPFDSNQAIPTLLFGRARSAFERDFPSLVIGKVEHLAGPSYAASGGFSRGPLLPMPLWSALNRWEARLPAVIRRGTAFRMLVTLERGVSPGG